MLNKLTKLAKETGKKIKKELLIYISFKEKERFATML